MIEAKEKTATGLETLAINTVRILAADAVQKANSGHPGTPMALAPLGHVLWSSVMNYNPQNPKWANRDRFILSAGHACMLQYSFLHLTGYDLTLNDIKKFRQLHSKTAGHPEYGLCPGIESTTGPLGQGFANGVGMAIARDYLAARYNKPGFDLFDYNIYVICSDGDMMEGITSEAASVAGNLKLGSLIYIYDDNHISIEGDTSITFTEDVAARFKAYGWHVQDLPDANDTAAIARALQSAKAETGRPSLIRMRSHIGYGSPNKVDTASAHGSALGVEEVRLVKQGFGFDPDQSFVVPDKVQAFYREAGKKGGGEEKQWNDLFKKYREQFATEADEFTALSNDKLPVGWKEQLPVFKGDPMATRTASGKVLNAIADKLPFLIGGSADLSPSTDTTLTKYGSFSAEHRDGRNFHFGIREHSMGAILNGMAVSGGFIPYGATFLIFSDYMRPPIRLAAISKFRTIVVYTHDSIGLGEDGTTHQPVEQLAALRAMPNLRVIRPGDANETAHAWRVAIEHTTGPVVLALTRQKIPVFDQGKYGSAAGLEKGAYILSESEGGKPQVILIGTGSEVSLCLQAQELLAKKSIAARVVSMPSWELFEKQDAAYRESVLPAAIRKRLSVEAASTMGWLKFVTDDGKSLGIERFGESAPAEEIFKEFGFTPENVAEMAAAL